MIMMNGVFYDDGLVALGHDGITMRRYYFPFGTSKRIPYARIRNVREWRMGPFTGKGRLWGAGDLRHWTPRTPLDLKRPSKDKALIFDVGAWVRPVITPADPNRVLSILSERTSPA